MRRPKSAHVAGGKASVPPNSASAPSAGLTLSQAEAQTLVAMLAQWVTDRGRDYLPSPAEAAVLAAAQCPHHGDDASQYEAFRMWTLTALGATQREVLETYLCELQSNALTIRDLQEQVQITREQARATITEGVGKGVFARTHSYWKLNKKAKIYLYRQRQRPPGADRRDS